MISALTRIVTAGAKQLSRLSSAVTTAEPSLLQPASCTNTTIVNTTAPNRGKHFDHHFINKWMARDYKRRQLVKQHYPVRQRYVAIKRCSVLPKELQEVASQELHSFPRDSCYTRLVRRCIFTSRPRWVITRYRVSRITWRLHADYNKLSGVLRATW